MIQLRANEDYWKARAEKRMDSTMLKADELTQKIGAAYLDAVRYIQSECEKIFRNFSKGISEAEAERLLAAVPSEEVIKRLIKAVGRIKDTEERAKVTAQINSPAYRARLDRLKQLAENAHKVCMDIAGDTNELMDSGLAEIVKNTYYRSIFDAQKGTGAAFGFSQISENTVKEILSTNWSGKHYSRRIWENTERLSQELEDCLLCGVLTGKSGGRMAEEIQTKMHSSYSQAMTLVRTESCYVNEQAELKSYEQTGTEKYRYTATLDSRTSKLCRSLDGKCFPVDEAQAGKNYPPMHPRCRSTTLAVIDEACCGRLERSARDPQTGEIQRVPADMTYDEWKRKYVDKNGKYGIINVGSDDVALEYQRYGRNKNTLVNSTYIESGEYRRKFDNATDNAEVNKALYDNAKKALKHRSGTAFEDMYWIDSNTGKTILAVEDSKEERAIIYNERIMKTIRKESDIITLHTHPSSMPPSASDLNSCFRNRYKKGFVACHNGRVFGYTANEEINERIYNMYIERYTKDGYDEFEAQMKALNKLSQTYDVRVWEVLHNERKEIFY